MANAWIIQPLKPISFGTIGTVHLGEAGNVFNDYAGMVCQIACDSGGAGVIKFDFGADVAVDTIIAFGVGLLPTSAVVSIAYSTNANGPLDGSDSTLPDVPAYAGSVRPVSGEGVCIASTSAPIVARYWQLLFRDNPTATGRSVRVGRIVIGKRIELKRNFSFGASFGVRDLGSLDFSARGVLLRRRAAKLRLLTLTFSNVEKDELEAQIKPLLEEIGNTEMVAIVTDPSPDAQRQNRCYYGPLVGDLGSTWRNARAFETKINQVSIF